ncbi:hypothetical protein Ahy_A04g021015 [Arachis hypogaea]|uniref:Bromo domain-containing protein n=1 Tax=Arachis hypogaea TaxID=3818 RepID=A0A445DJ49_ARAHY|nr:hypothetical protein Ahy_A04g021015 [Arachis hypogaea]
MSERSEVSWNIMIDSYASAGEYDTALRMFCEMQRIHDPDGYTMQSVISSCAGLGALSLGLWAYAYVLKRSDKNMIGDVLVNTSLCDSFEILYDKRYNLFHYSVSDEDAPNYHSIIQNPMDMVTMLQRVDNGWYITRSAFLQDIDLIVSNAKVYNGEDYNGARIVHGMISQMDLTLVAYCDKIAAQEVSVDHNYEALKHTKKSFDVARGAKDKSGQEPLPSKSQTQSTDGNLHGTGTNESVHGSSLEDATISDTELSTRL